MSLNVDLSAVGAWELTYYNKITGNAQNRRFNLPCIEPIEIPYLTESRIFLIGVSYLEKKPTWTRAGYLYHQIDGIRIDDTIVFEGLGSIPSTEVDYSRFLINLNTIQLITIQKLSQTARLRFEPLPWIPKITLAIWEYRGIESNSTEDLINAVRAKLETIEFKVDNL